jgi:hypothetical protein
MNHGASGYEADVAEAGEIGAEVTAWPLTAAMAGTLESAGARVMRWTRR